MEGDRRMEKSPPQKAENKNEKIHRESKNKLNEKKETFKIIIIL